MANTFDRRVKFLFPNLIYGATLAGGGWQAGDLSLDALQDPILGRPARSINADPANTQVNVTFDRPRDVGAMVALGHNMTTAGKVIVQGFSDAARTQPAFNEDGIAYEAYPPLFRTRDLAWSNPNWFSGKPLAEDIGLTTTTAIVLFGKNVSLRYWTIRFVDPFNGAGYLDVGKIFFAPMFDPPQNYDYGASLSVVDESKMTQSIGGARFYDKRGKRRRMTLNFSVLNEAQQFARFFDMNARLGTTEELFVIPDPGDTINLQRRSFCAHIKEPSPLEQMVYRHMGASYILEEDI